MLNFYILERASKLERHTSCALCDVVNTKKYITNIYTEEDCINSLLLFPVVPDVEELWIGLNDLRLQMNFEWSDGTPVQFTFWHPFEPNNFRDSLEDCVTIWGPV